MKLPAFLVAAAVFGLVLLGIGVPLVRAVEVPDFPSCVSPTGTLKVHYDTGIHGIVGSSGEYVGSDSVYIVGDSNLIQCFCSTTGQGIQTNWWRINSMDQEQIDTLKGLGWIFIPSGAPWGLTDTAYMASNSSYSCGGGTGGNGGGGGGGGAPVCTDTKPPTPTLLSVTRSGSSAQLVWTAVTPVTHYSLVYGTTPGNYSYGVANTGNVTSFTVGGLDPGQTYYFSVRAVNTCMPSDASGEKPTGQVLGAATGEVLGLAATGNSVWLWLLGLAGLAFLSAAWWLRHDQRDH